MGDLIAVFGAGISGKAVAALVELEGDKVHLYDEQEADCFSEFGQSKIKDYKCFIFSPGFPQKHPWRALLRGSDQVYGEVGFAAKRSLCMRPRLAAYCCATEHGDSRTHRHRGE